MVGFSFKRDFKVSPEGTYDLPSRDPRLSRAQLPEEQQQNNASFLTRLDYFLATSWFGLGLLVVNTILSVVSCGIFIAETYAEEESTLDVLFEWELILSGCFLFEYTLMLIAAKDKFEFILQRSSIVDLLTTVPLITVVALDYDLSG